MGAVQLAGCRTSCAGRRELFSGLSLPRAGRRHHRRAVARGYLLAWDWEANPDFRYVVAICTCFVFPPGLGAGTAHRGYGCDNKIGGANPACAAGGARGVGDEPDEADRDIRAATFIPCCRRKCLRIVADVPFIDAILREVASPL
jgi:hypothetical protein